MIRTSLFAVFLALIAVPAGAGDLAGRDVLLPIVARTPGALGTNWYTDLVITNLTTTAPFPTRVFIGYYANDGQLGVTRDLDVRESLVLPDVVKNTFGLDQSAGYVRVTAISPSARISVRARVFNRGASGGEYGQAIAGVPVDSISGEHFIAGLSGVDGNRSNVGVTNPWSMDIPVTFELFEASGLSRGSVNLVIGPRSVRQINNIFDWFGVAPFDGAMVRLKGAIPFFGYGTVVRNDSGDSTFVQGTGVVVGNDLLLPVQCSNPAPVLLAEPGSQTAGSWIVMFQDAVDARTTTQQLAARLGFTPFIIYEFAFKGFAAELTPSTIAALRCDPTVKVVTENVQAPIP
jgi:hypothetical protein